MQQWDFAAFGKRGQGTGDDIRANDGSLGECLTEIIEKKAGGAADFKDARTRRRKMFANLLDGMRAREAVDRVLAFAGGGFVERSQVVGPVAGAGTIGEQGQGLTVDDETIVAPLWRGGCAGRRRPGKIDERGGHRLYITDGRWTRQAAALAWLLGLL